MNASDYQKEAARTLIDAPDFTVTAREFGYLRDGLHLGALAGSVYELLKKGILHRHGLNSAQYIRFVTRLHDKTSDMIGLFGWPRRLGDSDPVSPGDVMGIWNILGLLGEAGEIAQLILDPPGGTVDRDKLSKEIGDLLWYAAALCTKNGIDLGDVMQANIEKLKQRYPQGWDAERSKAHVAPGLFITPAAAPAYLPNKDIDTLTAARPDLL